MNNPGTITNTLKQAASTGTIMKILWFTNTPCSAAEKMGQESHRGGWLTSLEKALHERGDIELSIAFYAGIPMAPFVHQKTNYYPLYRKSIGSKITRYFNKLLNKPDNDQQDLAQMLQVIEAVRPDVIHVHGTENNFGLIQAHTPIPVVVSIQGIIQPYSEKFFAGVPASIARRHESYLNKIKLNTAFWQYKDLQKWVTREQRIFRNIRHVIGRTDWDRRVASVLAPASTYYKNNEILRQPFYKHSWNKADFSKTIRLVTISSDVLYKGFETILKTARVLVDSGQVSFEWLVVGLHEQSLLVKTSMKWLKADCSQLHIKLLGSRGEKEIVQLLAEADIYCQVSHIENSPNSLCEAQMMGLPVVASYAGGTATMLDDGKAGVLVQDGDPYALAGAITELSRDFAAARQYGRQARQLALERHDPAAITGDLVNIYRTIGQNNHHPVKEAVRLEAYASK